MSTLYAGYKLLLFNTKPFEYSTSKPRSRPQIPPQTPTPELSGRFSLGVLQPWRLVLPTALEALGRSQRPGVFAPYLPTGWRRLPSLSLGGRSTLFRS